MGYNFHYGRLAPPHYNHVTFHSFPYASRTETLVPSKMILFRLIMYVFDPSAHEIFYTSFIYSHRPFSCSNYQTTCQCSRGNLFIAYAILRRHIANARGSRPCPCSSSTSSKGMGRGSQRARAGGQEGVVGGRSGRRRPGWSRAAAAL